jgi:hypothetical protein
MDLGKHVNTCVISEKLEATARGSVLKIAVTFASFSRGITTSADFWLLCIMILGPWEHLDLGSCRALV